VRRTPAGTAVLEFRLRVPASPNDPVVSGCLVSVVVFGDQAATGVAEGSEVEVEGSLTERRWRGPGGVQQSRYEILARAIRVM
jgi:single-stranded DNA-binding protein